MNPLDAFFIGIVDCGWLWIAFRDGSSWGAWALTLAIAGLELGALVSWIVGALLWAGALFAFNRYAKLEA